MIARIVVVPYPPLLVPELTVRAGSETEQLRAACLRAVSSLTECTARWVAIGVDRSGPCVLGPDTRGTFAGFGVDVPVALSNNADRATPDPLLPLPALVAGWLRGQAGAEQVRTHLLTGETAPDECRAYGAGLAGDGTTRSEGLLVLAEGTNCRNARSPHPPDDRAEPVDELIRTALTEVDTDSLLGLDPGLAEELGVEGRAAFQALAGTAESGGTWLGDLLYSGTPFGVTYHVAVWSRTDV